MAITDLVQVFTIDEYQVERCRKALKAKATISETFNHQIVTGQVQTVVNPAHGDPRRWSITFADATTAQAVSLVRLSPAIDSAGPECKYAAATLVPDVTELTGVGPDRGD